MLRLLLYSVPGCPVFETAERLSSFHKIPFFTFEFVPEDRDSYFLDKIPEITLDTNDMTSGSGQAQLIRDPASMAKDKMLDSFRAVPNVAYKSVNDNELSILSAQDQWICVTQIPDDRLIDLATHVIFFNTSDKAAIDWFSKRRKCPSCGNIHHLDDKPSKYMNVCDRCGTELIIKPEDDVKAIKLQYTEWRNAFWRFEVKAKHMDCHRTYAVEKFDNLNDLVLKVNRDYRSFIERKQDWYSKVIKDVKGDGMGPGDVEVSVNMSLRS